MNESSDNKKLKISARTSGRVLAVQGLYQMDMTREDVNIVMNNLRQLVTSGEIYYIDEQHCDFAHTEGLLRGIIAEQKTIDELIHKYLPETWSFKRLDKVMIAILRAGIYELLYVPETAKQIVLNEYTNIASSFSMNDNNNLVSGLLNKIAHR